METSNCQNAYIIQTIDLSTTNSVNDSSKECILNEGPVIISTTELKNAAQYITCYENGEVVLKELEGKNKNEIPEITINEEKPSIKFSNNSTELNLNSQVLCRLQPKLIRKKLCYEKPYNIKPLTVQTKHDNLRVLKHPRKHLFDHKIMISPREFKCQLIYTADTITKTKLAPCTRRQLVHVLNGITTLFAHPAHKMPNANLMQLYVSRCTCKKEPNMMSTDDMNLQPLIDKIAKPSFYNMNHSVKRIYSKRKSTADNSTEKIQIVENIPKESPPEINLQTTNINLSSIKKIYRNRKHNKESINDNVKSTNENIDHKYSKKISDFVEINSVESKYDENSMYTITLDIDNIKEEHITENQIVILSVDNDGELTENNINMLLDAANINTTTSKETNNLDAENINNKLSNIFVVRTSDGNNESEQISENL